MQAIDESHELRPGPARPGPVGLLIRVVLGAASVWGLVTNWDVFRDQDLIESDFWFITLLTLCLLPDVFNIGLRRRWGAWPLVVFLAGAVAIGLVGHLGEVWTTALAAWVYAGDLLVFGACRCRFRWRSSRGHRDVSSTRCRGWSRDCVARRMRRRGAAFLAWTCSISNRRVVPGALDEELDSECELTNVGVGPDPRPFEQKKERTSYGEPRGTDQRPFRGGAADVMTTIWNNLHDGRGPGLGCAETPERFDYAAYLDFLAEHGHNFIRLWRWEQVKSQAAGGDFHLCMTSQPWPRTGPGSAKDGKSKFDLDRFDEGFSTGSATASSPPASEASTSR